MKSVNNRLEEYTDTLMYLTSMRADNLRTSPVEIVAISSLADSDSPRVGGEDSEHIRMLAEAESALPPIIVHRKTMRIIDGMHRVRAAALRGQDRIDVQFFDGDEKEAFLLAVSVNTTHGLPLSLADRTAATERIFAIHPEWSDRAVASVAGLSAKKVAEVRRRETGNITDLGSRIGRDGRIRPLNSTHGRELAGELMKTDPQASLRQVAKAAGISPATAADVRDRLLRGTDPVPLKQQMITEKAAQSKSAVSDANKRVAVGSKSLRELALVFDALRRDPSLRFNETGRTVLRMFDACANATREKRDIMDNLPPHCIESMAELATGYAEILRSLAEELRNLKKMNNGQSASG